MTDGESPSSNPVGGHLVLLGLMGSGKSSIGRRVAERLGWPFLDGDEYLAERTAGRTAAEIADTRGLGALHELEADIALTALSAADPTVIGPAASVCESPIVRDALADQKVVWLTAPAGHLARYAPTKSHRPLLERGDAAELFERQRAVREPLVLPLAGLVIDVSTVTIDEAVDEIVDFVLRG